MAIDKQKVAEQEQEAQSLCIGANFVEALKLEFDKADPSGQTKGLLMPKIDALTQQVIALEVKLKQQYGPDFNSQVISEQVAKFLNTLIGRVHAALDTVYGNNFTSPDEAQLTQAVEIFTEHRNAIAVKFRGQIEQQTSLFINIEDAMKDFNKAFRELQELLKQFSTNESPADFKNRESLVNEFNEDARFAEETVAALELGVATSSLDHRNTFSATKAVAGGTNVLDFNTPYHALAATTFRLHENPVLQRIKRLSETKADNPANIAAWETASKRVTAIQEAAFGQDKKSGLAQQLFETDGLTDDLVTALTAFTGIDLDGTGDYRLQVTALETARTNFVTNLQIPGPAEDPDGVFEKLKASLEKEASEKLAEAKASQLFFELKADPAFNREVVELDTLANKAEQLSVLLRRNRASQQLGIEEVGSLIVEAEQLLPELNFKLGDIKSKVPNNNASVTVLLEQMMNPIQIKIDTLNGLVGMETNPKTMSDNVLTYRIVNYKGGAGGGFPFEETSTLAAQGAQDLYDSFGVKFGGFTFSHLIPRAPEIFKKFQMRLLMLVGRLKDKLGDNDTPSASREYIEKKDGVVLTLIDLLNIGRQDILEGIIKDPEIGGFFKKLLWRTTWMIGLKEGYAADETGKLFKLTELARLTPPAYDLATRTLLDNKYVVYNPRFDYNKMVSASGKANLAALVDDQFNTMLNLPEFSGNRLAIESKKEIVDGLARGIFIGFNFMDKCLSLRQWFGEQTKSHDTASKTNYGLIDNLFAAMLHNINRYDKGMELTTAIYSMFYADIRQHPHIDRMNERDVYKISAWQKMIDAYFKAANISLKGAKGEIDPMNSRVQKNGIPLPQWNDEVFPSWETVLTDERYNTDQKWTDYQTSRSGWQAFVDFVGKPLPAKIDADNVMALIGDNMSESKVLGVAKLVKGPHWEHIPAMMTFKINEMVTKTRLQGDQKIELLKQIIERLKNIKEHGLKDLASQVQKVIDNVYGDRGFNGFDNAYRAKNEEEHAQDVVDYLNIVEAFKNGHFKDIVNGTHHKEFKLTKPTSFDIRALGQYKIMPPISDVLKTPEARAKLIHETQELNKLLFSAGDHKSVHPLDLPPGVFPAPFGHSIAASAEKVGDAHK